MPDQAMMVSDDPEDAAGQQLLTQVLAQRLKEAPDLCCSYQLHPVRQRMVLIVTRSKVSKHSFVYPGRTRDLFNTNSASFGRFLRQRRSTLQNLSRSGSSVCGLPWLSSPIV